MPSFKTLDLSKSLKIKPKLAIKYLKLNLGEKVKKDQIIALKKGLLGSKLKIRSPVDGILERLEESTGNLIIKVKEPWLGLKKAKAADVAKRAKHVFKGVFGFGKNQGKLLYLKETLKVEDLKDKYAGLILACLKLSTKGVFFKAAALDVSGLVVGQIKKENALSLKKVYQGEDFSFLAMSFDKKIDFVKEFDGKDVVCDGDQRSLIIV